MALKQSFDLSLVSYQHHMHIVFRNRGDSALYHYFRGMIASHSIYNYFHALSYQFSYRYV